MAPQNFHLQEEWWHTTNTCEFKGTLKQHAICRRTQGFSPWHLCLLLRHPGGRWSSRSPLQCWGAQHLSWRCQLLSAVCKSQQSWERKKSASQQQSKPWVCMFWWHLWPSIPKPSIRNRPFVQCERSMIMRADSTINYYARQEVSWPPDFDQLADVYCRAFGFYTSACYLPGT